jgi:glycosyltransferase 2 family protein
VRPRTKRTLRVAFAATAAALLVAALVGQWDAVSDSLGALSVASVIGSAVLVLAGTACGMLAWRAVLADLGSPLPVGPASHVFFLSQLGKYLPGSLWNYVAQVELARDHDVPRHRSGAAAVVALGISTTAALVLACIGIATMGAGSAIPLPVLLLVAVAGLTLLHPPVLSAVLATLLRLARREPLERSLSRRGVARATAWAAGSWLLYGTHVWLLVDDLGEEGLGALPLSVAAFAAAWSAGFLFVVAPAGAGAREAALVLGLAPVLATAEATVVAVISRLLFTLGDLLLCGGAVLQERSRRSRAALAAAVEGTPAEG